MIIMLAGRRKSGKTAFAEAIVEFGFGHKVCSFADALKSSYAERTGVDLADLYDVQTKELHRSEMVKYADSVRAKDRFFFPKLLFAMIDDGPWIIDDLRTIEELEMGLQLGAVPYRVYADSITRQARGWKYHPFVDEHYLETEMDLSAETFTALGGGWIWNNTNNKDDLKFRAFTLLTDI